MDIYETIIRELKKEINATLSHDSIIGICRAIEIVQGLEALEADQMVLEYGEYEEYLPEHMPETGHTDYTEHKTLEQLNGDELMKRIEKAKKSLDAALSKDAYYNKDPFRRG